MPVVNVGETNAALYPHHSICVLSRAKVVSLPDGVSFIGHQSGGGSPTVPPGGHREPC